MGRARRVSERRLRKIGEDHLKGTFWSVRERNCEMSIAALDGAEGSHFQSLCTVGSAHAISNSLSSGASPILGNDATQ